MNDTPRTDGCELNDGVPYELAEWLERSRRDNIRKRWEMRKCMQDFEYTFTDYMLNKSMRTNAYIRYLQGIKK